VRKKKYRRDNQTDMKSKCDNGQYGVPPPALCTKRNDPMQDRSEAVVPAHVREYKGFFLFDQLNQFNNTVEATTEK
jgi:hypothetical protein